MELGAHYAKYGILIARTDPDAPKHRGVTYFLIDMTQPGVEVRPLREMTGDAAFNEVFFDDARVHDSDRVGADGEGWRIAMTTLRSNVTPATPASATPLRSTKPTSRCRWVSTPNARRRPPTVSRSR